MTERQVYALAGATWGAAMLPVELSRLWLVPVAAMAVLGWRRGRPALIIVASVVAASIAAGAAWADLTPAVERSFEGAATLMSDPIPTSSGIRVTADIEGERYDVRAWGTAAGHMRNRLMGERVTMQVSLRPLDDAPRWLRAQGITGRGTVRRVDGFDVGHLHTRIANSVRRTLESGASSLSIDERSLFSGLVYGDDRNQTPLTADNFEAAGLTHLLAVSGQNVAFVLAIVGPMLRRLERRPRFVFVLVILLLFATITRFEPSVVRASVMTGLAAVATLVGVEVESRRILGLAIVLLVLVDPLIVHSVAFQLSVAASAGILFWSARVARAMPGPRPFIETLAVTASAQLAVAPLLVWRFDGLPVASLPANLLAAPAAGPVMMWGLTAGLVAGLAPAFVAMLIHQPTVVGLWWIDSVAVLARRVPLGLLGAVHVALLFAIATVGLRQTRRVRRVGAVAALGLVLLQPAVGVSVARPASVSIDHDSRIWRDRSVTVVELGPQTRPGDVLASLRTSGVGDIDLVIARRSNFATASLLRWMQSNHDLGTIWAPELTMGIGEQIPPQGAQVPVSGTTLHVDAVDDQLVVARNPR